MSEEEIINYLKNSLNDEFNFKNCTRVKDKQAIQGLLELYNKEKENTNKLIRYISLKENKDYEQVKEEFEIGG